MPIQVSRDSIRLEVVHSVYRKKLVYIKVEQELLAEEKEVLKKELRVKKWFKKEAIVSVEDYVTKNNTIAKSRCVVFDKYSGRFYATFHSPQDVMEKIDPFTKKDQIGFKR